MDSDYKGELGVVLYNHSEEDFKVNEGDIVAQLILKRIKTPVVQKVQALDPMDKGARGLGVPTCNPRDSLSWVKRVKQRKRILNLLNSEHSLASIRLNGISSGYYYTRVSQQEPDDLKNCR